MSPGEEESSAVPELSLLEQEEKARAHLLRVLAAAPKSRAQLETGLASRGISEEVARALLDRFEDVGLVDDVDYAERMVRTRFAERRQARRAIAQELNRKGIASDVAEGALSQIDADDEAEAALHLAGARLRRTTGLPREVRVRRAMAALGRKGYSPGVAMQCIQQVLGAEGVVDASDPDALSSASDTQPEHHPTDDEWMNGAG